MLHNKPRACVETARGRENDKPDYQIWWGKKKKKVAYLYRLIAVMTLKLLAKCSEVYYGEEEAW